MRFALTTRWNAGRHTSGEAMIEEILDLGFHAIELGYNLRMDLVPGVKRLVEEKAATVDTVHNFCPVPVGAPMGHPELFTLSDPDPRIRQSAVQHTSKTIRFAEEIGAKAVVLHAGNVSMKRMTEQLVSLYEQGRQFTPQYEKAKIKLLVKREKKVTKQLEYLYRGIEALLPVLEETKVKLAIENLPTWESVPTEMEMEGLINHFNTDLIGCWHDIGHGAVRQFLGLINQERWMEKLQTHLIGMHIHDAHAPMMDHLVPPNGEIDFARYKRFASMDVYRVFEPSSDAKPEEIKLGYEYIRNLWAT